MSGVELAAWAWVQHLRCGGKTRWSAWVASGAVAEPPPGWSVPGAAQLELVRRLNVAGPRTTSAQARADLADRVLARSGPGRGLAQQPLLWPPDASGARAYGAPPVDPSDVPTEELLRVGTGVLTDLLLAADQRPPEQPRPRRRGLTRAPAFRLDGPPVTTSAVRVALARAGHLEGGWSPRVLVLAEPLDAALGQVWSARVQGGAPVRWRGFLRRWAGRDALPPGADVLAQAGAWAGRAGSRVEVVMTGGGVDRATRIVAGLLQVPLDEAKQEAPAAGFAELPPAGVDLLRRVNAVLAVGAPEEEAVRVRRQLVELVAARAGEAAPPAVPEACRPWMRERAERMGDRLGSDRYRVHGHARDLLPDFTMGHRIRRAEVLDLVLDLCLHVHGRTDEEDRDRD